MPYKIFISADGDAASRAALNAVRATLFQTDDFPVTAISPEDVVPPDADRLAVARSLIASAQLYIGIFGQYGAVPPGQTQSYNEIEYHMAHERSLLCLIFVPEAQRTPADERLASFLAHLANNHVLNYFSDTADLQAQVARSLDKFRQTQQHFRTLTPPPLAFQPAPPAAEPGVGDALEALVARALAIAADDIEAIVRRALVLHAAQHHPTSGGRAAAGMTVNPIFGAPLTQGQFQADIFMIMPFRPAYDSIYHNVVRPVVSELNLTIKRGDDFASLSGAIINEVWAALNACRLVIVETTEVNANVYYELGIAHTLGKPAILLTQEKEVQKLPFDIRHLRFIVYENTIPGGEKLEADLRRTILWILNDLDAAKGQTTNGDA